MKRNPSMPSMYSVPYPRIGNEVERLIRILIMYDSTFNLETLDQWVVAKPDEIFILNLSGETYYFMNKSDALSKIRQVDSMFSSKKFDAQVIAFALDEFLYEFHK